MKSVCTIQNVPKVKYSVLQVSSQSENYFWILFQQVTLIWKKVKITVLLLVMYAKPFCLIVPLKSLRDHQNLPLCHRFRWLLEQITVAQYKFKFFGFLKLPILLKFYKLTFYMDPSRLFKNLDPALKHFVYHVPNLWTCSENNYFQILSQIHAN